MPFIKWDQKNTKYVLTLLPLSGLVTGALEAGWFFVTQKTGLHAPLYAAIACVLPLLLHGGIHLDGLADTADASASYASVEKKREILADPHTGAFGAAAIVFYELVTFGVFCEVCEVADPRNMDDLFIFLMITYLLPMTLTLFASAVIAPAVPDGMLYSLTSVAQSRLNAWIAIMITVVCLSWVAATRGFAVFVFVAVTLLVFLYFRRLARKQFGGISGDLCGWLIKISETVMLTATMITLKWF